MSIDGNRDPNTSLMNGKFNSGNLSSDPGTIHLGLVLAGTMFLRLHDLVA